MTPAAHFPEPAGRDKSVEVTDRLGSAGFPEKRAHAVVRTVRRGGLNEQYARMLNNW